MNNELCYKTNKGGFTQKHKYHELKELWDLPLKDKILWSEQIILKELKNSNLVFGHLEERVERGHVWVKTHTSGVGGDVGELSPLIRDD